MQLQLIPPPPHPTILFSFVLPTAPPTLPFPPAYQQQLQLLLHTDLDPPPSPYTLDKAVWPVYLLEMVTFDMTPSRRMVTVKMTDGAIIQWPIHGEEALLSQVMADVEKSAREAEKESKREATDANPNAYLPLTNSAILSNTTFREEIVAEPSTSPSANHRPTHRKSKSLFNSLLSALNLTSSENKANSVPPVPRLGGCGSRKAFESDADPYGSRPRRSIIPVIPTSEFTFPEREQLPVKTVPASKAFRRQARSTLVDCVRRWVIPTVKERIQWGSFLSTDGADDGFIEESARWGKMSKATNAYLDWACRSMIGRCEVALRAAERSILQQESLSVRGPNAEISEKESRRSSASSTLASAISASSRASSSRERVEEIDGDDGPVQMIISAAQRTPRASTSTESLATSMRHAATLRSALDKFRCLHDDITNEARGLADSHTMAMRILEERGRRRGWSSSEGSGTRRVPLTVAAYTRLPAKSPSSDDEWATPVLPLRELGRGTSPWEMSIPIIRSSLGEISSTWEDWQMEWEMEHEFGSDEGSDPDGFPDVISDFDGTGDAISNIDLDLSSRTISLQRDVSDTAECHSEFSDSSSDGEGEVSDPSPTSPFGFPPNSGTADPESGRQEPPSPGAIMSAKRSRKTGVKARLGTYEDVRDELPPSPPLMSLSPPPRSKVANGGKESEEGPTNSTTGYDRNAFTRTLQNSAHLDTNGHRQRSSRPTGLQLSPMNRLSSTHRREAADAYADFAQSRISDVQAGVFDVWEDDEDEIFGARTDEGMAQIHQQASAEGSDNALNRAIDGVGIQEHAGGLARRQPYQDVGSGFPPGLHGDIPFPPPLPKKSEAQDNPRRTSFYVERGLPSQPSMNQGKRPMRSKPQLTLNLRTSPKRRPSDSDLYPLHQTPSSAPAGTVAFADVVACSSSSSQSRHAHVRVADSVPMSAPPTMFTTPTFSETIDEINAIQQKRNDHVGCQLSCDVDAEHKEAPALLLDTPTVEYPSSTYPYTWELSVVPRGVTVIGTVGDREGADANGEGRSEMSKPLLCVTPPADAPSLGRLRSWKSRSAEPLRSTGGLRRRQSADSSQPSPPPANGSPEPMVPASPSTSSPMSDEPVATPTSTSSLTRQTVSRDVLTEGMALDEEEEEEEDGVNVGYSEFGTGHAVSPRTTSNDTPNVHCQPHQPGKQGGEVRPEPSMEEAYHIPDIWFAKPRPALNSPNTALVRTKSMSNKKVPPPPRPAKNLKRSLSLNSFAKRIASFDSS